MARLRTNNVFGTTTNNPLASGGTSLSSAGLANLVAVTGSDYAVVTLDPNRVHGAPEIVYVTAHTAANSSATILRGQEGTAARAHPSGTFWVHGATALDVERVWDPPACRVHHNANTSCPSGSLVTVAFNSERFDTDNMHSTVTNNNRVTINTPGIYTVTFIGDWATAADYNFLWAGLRLNGTTWIGNGGMGNSGGTLPPPLNATTVYKFVAGDWVDVQVLQVNSAAAARNLTVDPNRSPELTAVWLGSGD